MSLGQRIKEARKLKGISQSALSEKIGISLRTLQRFEKNERLPNVTTIFNIAQTLQVPLDQLLETNPDGTVTLAANDTDAVLFFKHILKKGMDKSTIIFDDDKPISERELNLAASLLLNLFKLNEKGQQKACDNIEDLTKIPEYQKKNEDSEE